MQRRTVIKWTGIPILAAVALLFVAYFAFVPSAQEPGYTFIAAWGEGGHGPGQFRDPTGIAVADGEVFVADSRNGRIQVFDFDGNFKRTFGRPGDGSIYVADFYNQRIQRFGPDDSFVRQWGTTGEVGISAGEFNYPTDVALAPGGTLYVADGYNDRIQVFGPDGVFIRKWGGPFGMNIFGPFNGWFATVTGLTVGPDGNIFVADFYNDRIQKFAPDGAFLTAFGETGNGPGRFRHPIAVAVAKDGTVIVADFLNHRVQKWRPPG